MGEKFSKVLKTRNLYNGLIEVPDILLHFVQVFGTSLNGNTYGTKYRLSGNKSSGLGKMAK